MSSWAKGLCGPPDQAVAKLWRGRLSIEKIIAPTHSRMSNRDGLGPRELGRKFAKAWLTSRVKPSHPHKLEKLQQASKINFGGLLTYLEMAIALVPDLTAARLCCVWELPEPIWAREPNPEEQTCADAPATPEVQTNMSRFEAPRPDSELEPAQLALVSRGAPVEKARPRHRRQKPTWTVLEQELIYEKEISDFLSTIKPGSQSSSCPPQGYQAKLHSYIHGGFEGKDDRAKVCPHCDNYFCWGSFCATCGSIRPGREEQAKEAVSKFASSRRGFDSPEGMKAILDLPAASEALDKDTLRQQAKFDLSHALACGKLDEALDLLTEAKELRTRAESPAIGAFPDTRRGSMLGKETKLDSHGRISISVDKHQPELYADT